MIRGGNWNNGGNAGVFNSNLNNGRGNSNSNIGGRSAFRLMIDRVARRSALDKRADCLRASVGAQTKRGLFPLRRTGDNHIAAGAETPHTAETEPFVMEHEMKTIQTAWQTVCSFEWLLRAHQHARKKKRYRSEVMVFSARLEDNLLEIQRRMLDGSYQLGPYRKLWVDVPKKRLVMALPYPDRIVQWSIYLYLKPFYEKLFIEDSFACRDEKGSHKAARRLQSWIRQVERKPGKSWYYLKLDISKYFYRIHHDTLLSILERRIKDRNMMNFIRGIVNSKAEPFGLPKGRKPENTPPDEWLYDVGMPIGNLTSQLFANIYLNELDQFGKHVLKAHYYIRYMDDVILLAPDKEKLHGWLSRIENFLKVELHLDLNEKTCIRPISAGIEFVGIRIYPHKMRLRKSTTMRMKRETRQLCRAYAEGKIERDAFERRVSSIKGMLEHTQSDNLRRRLNEIYLSEVKKAEKEGKEMSNLQIIETLEELTEQQANVIRSLARRLAELGDTETGKDEIAEADRLYRAVIGGDELTDF